MSGDKVIADETSRELVRLRDEVSDHGGDRPHDHLARIVVAEAIDAGLASNAPTAALVFCQPSQVDFSVINGKIVVDDGQILGLDLRALVDKHNRLASECVARTEERFGHDMSTKIWNRAWEK
jgi:hypothetical protein